MLIASPSALPAPKVAVERRRLWVEVLLAIVILPLWLGMIVGVSLVLGQASVNLPPEVLERDLELYRMVALNPNPQLVGVIFTFFNDPGVDYTFVIAGCLGYVWWKRRGDMVAAVAAVGLTLIVGAWTIPYTHTFGLRPRPFMLVPELSIDPTWRQIWNYNPTFPSGHLREVTGLCVVLSYFWSRARWLAVLYAGFLAFSRLYIGAHFPTDVLAGMFIGLLAGTFSVLAIDRGKRIVLSLAEGRVVRTVLAYVLMRQTTPQRAADPPWAKAFRSLLFLGLLLATTYVVGLVVYTTEPRVLADYLRNTDNSLVYPILNRFDAASAQWVYWIFADGSRTIPALAFIALCLGALGGARRLGQTAAVIVLTFVVAQVIVILIAPDFERARPAATGEVKLPEMWRDLWPGPASLPDRYLIVVMALSSVLARLRARVRIPAYLYPMAVAASLLYFGAAWPTDVAATLAIGFLVAEYALLLSRQILPSTWVVGHDHAKCPRDDAAGNGGFG